VSGRAERSPSTPARLPRVSLDSFGEPELTEIDDRSAHVLRMRTGMVDGRCRTLKEIGEELDISPVWVRQIQRKALARIRDDREAQRHMGSADYQPRRQGPKASS
jgi:DNA-directed RNA polymerase sigma subunit (sigma70/sigma32)